MTEANVGRQKTKVQNDNVADRKEPPEYVFVGSNFHSKEARSSAVSYYREQSQYSFPERVSLGFRNNFWRVFSSLAMHERPNVTFEWLGLQWTLYELWVADSQDVDFAHYLEDPRNVFVVFVLKPGGDEEYKSIRELMHKNGLDEQQLVANLLSSIPNQSTKKYLSTFKHSRNLSSLFSWSGSFSENNRSGAVALFCFYCFCLLMTWKIGRDQTRIELHVEQRNFRSQVLSILKLRSQIINVERFFLTKNISNNHEMKSIAMSLRKKFQLRTKIDGFLPLNESMERHLTTAAQLRADDKITTLNLITFIIALVGLPTAVISTLLALNLSSPVIIDGLDFFLKTEVLSFLLLVVSSVLIPLFLFAVIFFLLSRRTLK